MSNDVFPALPGLTWDIKRNPKFKTITHETIGGSEARATFMAFPFWEFELSYEIIRDRAAKPELESLMGFFMKHQGSLDTWLYDCPEDNAVTDMQFGTGNGSTLAFQLTRTYGGFIETINNYKTNPTIKVDGVTKTAGVDYNINTTGLVTFISAPANGKAITWTGGFYYRCRFMEDITDFNQFARKMYELSGLTFIGSPVNKL